MSAVEHDRTRLGAYLLGALDAVEVREFEAHLISCAACRYELAELSPLRDELDQVPPEAFLDGPPEGGELLLRRAINRIRDEEAARRRRWSALAGAAALIIVALGAGVFIGHQTASDSAAQPTPTASSPPAIPTGVRRIEATDPATGVRLNVAITPATGWVRVHITAQGLREGEKCRLLVVPKRGEPVEAGSWVVPPKSERPGPGVDGSALVPLDDVAAIEIVTFDGQKLVSAAV